MKGDTTVYSSSSLKMTWTPFSISSGVFFKALDRPEPGFSLFENPHPLLYNYQRLRTRNRQIDIGKNTRGYRNLEKLRNSGLPCPETPNPCLECSKRAFDSKMKEWRRGLHNYDDLI